MDRFEIKLKDALQREEPLQGFESRVAAQVRQSARRRWWQALAFLPRRWAAVAAMCLLSAGSLMLWRQQELERARGEAARAQVMTALQITGTKWRFVQSKVQNLSQRDEEGLR